MKQLTVNKLLKQCQDLVAQGRGEYTIALSDDDEFNGLHGAWTGATLCSEVYANDLAFQCCNTDYRTTIIIS